MSSPVVDQSVNPPTSDMPKSSQSIHRHKTALTHLPKSKSSQSIHRHTHTDAAAAPTHEGLVEPDDARVREGGEEADLRVCVIDDNSRGRDKVGSGRAGEEGGSGSTGIGRGAE